MTFDVTAKDITATTYVKCHVRMWNHKTMLWKGCPGREIHSVSLVHWLKMLQKAKKWDQNYTFCPIFKKIEKGLEIQDFSTVKYRGRNNAFFPENCRSLQVKVIIKLTKMTK